MIKQAAHPSSFDYIGRLFSQNRKKAVMYGLLCVVTSISVSLFFFASEQSPASYTTTTAARLICFAVMGIVNSYFFYKHDLFPELATQETKLAVNALLFIAIAMVLFVFYAIAASHAMVMALADSGAFLLPFLVCQSWIAYSSIPMRVYAVWHLPRVVTTAAHTTINSMQVQLKILRRSNDESPDTYPLTASGKLSPGTIFSIFIAGRPIHGSISDIQLADERQQSFGWFFYEEKWGGLYRRHLDPSISLFSNHVRPNAKILILRASQPN